MTKRESILQAIKSRLTSVTGVLDANIYRSRVEPLSRGKSPAIVVEPLSDSADPSMTGVMFWTLQVRLSVIVRGDPPDQVADPILESIHSKIAADLSLGGLAMDIQPSNVTFELIEGDQPVGIISLDYRVQYRTSADSLSG